MKKTAIAVVLLLLIPTMVHADVTVSVGQGTMTGTICPGGLGTCDPWRSFDYSGPIELTVERRPNAPGESECYYPNPEHDTYLARTLDPVTYTNSDGTTGTGYASIYIGDDYPANCYRPTMITIDDLSYGGGFGEPSGGVYCSGVLGGEVYGSTSEPSSGRYCIDYITSINGGVFGESWDGITLQEVLDAEYGVGTINAAEDYEGFHPGDADPAYWEDIGVNSILVREIAGFENANLFGWYEEDLAGVPVLDGVGDGVIFDGPTEEGAEMYLEFPGGITRFGFYLNPNGIYSTTNAPEPEAFFTNRYYNDIGPDGSGAVHPPLDGDLQCLIYDISHLRGGLPTYVLAWEDLDAGAALSAEIDHLYTDNDYNDLVIEVSAFSPVQLQPISWSAVKAAYR